MDGTINPNDRKIKATPYGGYYRRLEPKEAEDVTHSDPGTPLGEYMRRFWQPVCLSDQLKDVPLAVRVLGENLVAFRDKGGRVGVLHRHCCHRGASLEYGIIQDRGIRCCYHGMKIDVDGTILDAPAENDHGARMRQVVTQGAYPAFERDGLVFAYMGPPDEMPPHPNWDAFEKKGDVELVPFSNVFPCNWLQVLENICDQMHTYALHNMPLLYDGNVPNDYNWQAFTLANFAREIPVMDYLESRNGTAMTFIAGRRVDDEKVWLRIQDCILPNMTEHAYLFEDGAERRVFHRVHMARWYVPIDNTNSIIFGWRMFGKKIDPYQKGCKERVGWDDMDFLEGQVGNRSYQEAQRLPGDWEAISSQRPIAIHALENPISSDIGVFLFRRLLRNAVHGRNPAALPAAMHARVKSGRMDYCYTQNDVLRIPKRPNRDEDRALVKRIGRGIVEITAGANDLELEERNAFIIARIEELERTAPTL
jgi:phenylpropionate dioxygenase-like ring-hydroxylating dioxygenase large terminal subunit